MSFDVARVTTLTVLNGGTDSAALDIHLSIADAINLLVFSPASLNTGVFQYQITPDDPSSATALWYNTGIAVPGAGAVALVNPFVLAAIGFRIHATTPPTADTTFKVSKQYWASGRF